jgi:tetratricopeptide (TPR) repeat protein
VQRRGTKSANGSFIQPLLLLIAGVAVYSNTLAVPFLFDDRPKIVTTRSIEELWPADTTRWMGLRPVVRFSLAVNYAFGGRQVTGYHVVNLTIHLLAALTLFGIVRRTLIPNRLAAWLAFAVALVWLVHPLQTQAVTYIIQRAEALMGLCYLLTLYCVIRSAQSRYAMAWGVVAIVVCALGMGTKAVMVTAPLVILLYDRTLLTGSFAVAIRTRPWLYLGLALTWLILYAQFHGGSVTRPGATAGFGFATVTPIEYARTQPRIVLHYLRLVFWPDPLCFDYGWQPARTAAEFLPAVVVILGLLAAVVWALWRALPLGFLGASFFLVLAPTSTVMPIQDLAVEHRMYLPLAAVVALVVMVTYRWIAPRGYVATDGAELREGPQPWNNVVPCKPPCQSAGGDWYRWQHWLVIGALAIVVVALGARTYLRNRDYRSPQALWQSVVEAAPENPRGHNNLGIALAAEGHGVAAIECFRRALALNPSFARGHFNLARVLQAQDDLVDAANEYRQALRIDPHYLAACYNLANLRLRQGQLDAAIDHYRAALRIRPKSARTHHNLAVALLRTGQMDTALQHANEAHRLAPDDPGPLNTVAWILATDARADVRDPAKAIVLAEHAAQLAGQQDPVILDTLAAAYASAGQRNHAVATAERARRLALQGGNAALAKSIERRLESYRDAKP